MVLKLCKYMFFLSCWQWSLLHFPFEFHFSIIWQWIDSIITTIMFFFFLMPIFFINSFQYSYPNIKNIGGIHWYEKLNLILLPPHLFTVFGLLLLLILCMSDFKGSTSSMAFNCHCNCLHIDQITRSILPLLGTYTYSSLCKWGFVEGSMVCNIVE